MSKKRLVQQVNPDSINHDVDIENGLTTEQLNERISLNLVNGDQDVKTKSIAQILRENIVTFFNFVFVALAIILCFFIDIKENFISGIGNFGFMILIVFNALIGIFQEVRAKKKIDQLSLISAPKTTTIRNNQEIEVSVKDIALDDIVLLKSGSQICADAKVVDGTIEVNESLITGEPDAIIKNPGDELMSGSFVVSGNAKAQVIHVGLDNFATKISNGAKYFKKPNSEIYRSLMFIVKVMSFVIVPLGIILFCVKHFLQGGDLNETAITTIGTIIGMIPSGLVALSSTVFCVSVIRLSKHNTLAQDLYCVETLARVDVLCLDKTGTITEGTMDVEELIPQIEQDESYFKQTFKNLFSALADENATANALREYSKDFNKTEDATQIVPFSSARKWSGARIGEKSYVIGAAEFVFPDKINEIKSLSEEKTKNGFRVMVLASSNDSFNDNALPNNLTLEALISISDKIRKEAPDTLRFFKEEGVNVKIISGDNPETVRAIAKRAGLEDCENIVDMSTLHTEQEVREAADKYSIFGRVLPDQKLTLVNALKANGHTVAMTGDGVNDVLALKSADCSIAMASGSDAAKNVSSLVLLDSNFASMPKVVAEGRRSINNLERSAALYLMKTIYNTLLAILFMIVTEPLPFAPQNLTLMGGVTIGLPSIVLALEPNKDRVTGRFLPKVLANSFPGGITVVFAAIAAIICHNYFLTDLTPGQSTSLFIIIITFVGFMLLFKVAWPFNWLHLVTYILMIGIFIACYLVPTPKDIVIDFFGLDANLTLEMGEALLSMAAALLPIYAAFVIGMHFFRKKTYDKFEKIFEKLDIKLR